MRLIDFLAGTTVGIIQTIIGQPLDYIKVKYQTTQINQNKRLGDFNKQILSKNKVLGYYRGSSSLIFALPFVTGFYFSLNQTIKRRLVKLQNIKSLRPPQQVLKLRLIGVSGVVTGLISSLLICPVQYAKVKRQVSPNPQVKGSFRIIFDAIKNGEIKKLYSGLTSTFKRQAFGGFLYFTVYEQSIREICRIQRTKRQYADYWIHFIAGGITGFVYWTAIYPWDHIKTRVQSKLAGELQRVSSLKSIYRGYVPAVLRGTLANAVGLAIYEQAKDLFEIFDFISKA